MINRSCLKWPGGKGSIVNDIKKHLPVGKRLIEPFVGAGNVFINTDYDGYILNDINEDLIDMYKMLLSHPEKFINDLWLEFQDSNTPADYALNRSWFNRLAPEISFSERWKKSLLFVYLNRHGYNGLCRYSDKSGFNVPFGKYKKVYFPRAELKLFAEKLGKATLMCGDFESVINKAVRGDVVYCDPPYIPVSSTSDFTQYYGANFTVHDHKRLRNALLKAVGRGASVVLSNSDTALAQYLYHCFVIKKIKTHRSIGAAAGSRKGITELIVIKTPSLKVCDGCGHTGGGKCPDCGPAMGDATYNEMLGKECFDDVEAF